MGEFGKVQVTLTPAFSPHQQDLHQHSLPLYLQNSSVGVLLPGTWLWEMFPATVHLPLLAGWLQVGRAQL